MSLATLTLLWLGLSFVSASAMLLCSGLIEVWPRLARAYDESKRGRRLAGRLDDAGLELTPAEWRLGQAILAVPSALALAAGTGSIWMGFGLAMALVRTGGGVLLRARRGYGDAALEAGSVLLARRLATELDTGVAAGDALQHVVAVGRAAMPTAVARLLVEGARRVSLGEEPAIALALATRWQAGRPPAPGARALSRLAATFALAARVGDGAALRHLADALDAARQARNQARASAAEARLAAIAVPVLAAVVAAAMIAGDPAIAAAALSLPELPVLGACALIALAGVSAVRRVTAA
jgi:hypothetical protein